MTDLAAFGQKLNDALPGALKSHVVANNELTVEVEQALVRGRAALCVGGRDGGRVL